MSARHADYAESAEAPLGRGRHGAGRLGIIYVPACDTWPETADYCIKWMARQHIELSGVVVDEDGSKWPGALDAVTSGAADLVVVARRSDIPVCGVAVVEELVASQSSSSQVRPRRLRAPDTPAGHAEQPGPVPPRRPKRVA